MRSLRQRLRWTLLAWLAAVLSVFGAVTWLLARQNLQADLDQFVREKAFILGQQVNPSYPRRVIYNEKAWQSDRYTVFGQTFDAD